MVSHQPLTAARNAQYCFVFLSEVVSSQTRALGMGDLVFKKWPRKMTWAKPWKHTVGEVTQRKWGRVLVLCASVCVTDWGAYYFMKRDDSATRCSAVVWIKVRARKKKKWKTLMVSLGIVLQDPCEPELIIVQTNGVRWQPSSLWQKGMLLCAACWSGRQCTKIHHCLGWSATSRDGLFVWVVCGILRPSSLNLPVEHALYLCILLEKNTAPSKSVWDELEQ